MSIRASIVLLTLLTAASCTSPDPEKAEGSWVGTITTEGDVTTVVNESGSVWGGAARLVEEASIGVDTGPGEYMFGQISSVFTSDDRIFVADPQVPAVRIYNLEGQYFGDLGGRGQGPGEYARPMIVGGFEDGRLFVFDRGAMRFNIYSDEGSPVGTWPALYAHCCDLRFIGGPGNTLWGVLRSPDGSFRTGVHAYTPDGAKGDTRWPEEIPYTPLTYRRGGEDVEGVPFRPGFTWSVTGEGDIVAGATDRYYFEVQRQDGSKLSVERRIERVPIPDERVEYERRRIVNFIRERYDPGWSWDGAQIPRQQPVFSFFVPALSGETWVVRPGRSERLDGCVENPLDATVEEVNDDPCWVNAWIVDAFDPEGRFLGSVDIPSEVRPFQLYTFIRDQLVVAVTMDDAAVMQVKRYQLVLPGAPNGPGD